MNALPWYALMSHGTSSRLAAGTAGRRSVLCLAAALAVAGCGGGGNGTDAAPSSGQPTVPTVPTASPTAGRFVGTARMEGLDHFADALLTRDGTLRVYLGDLYSPSGAMQGSASGITLQFVGNVAESNGRVSGRGRVFAQGCSQAPSSTLCSEPVEATVTMVPASALELDIQVHFADGDRLWQLDLASWDHYFNLPARLDGIAGQYREELAEFGPDGMLLNLDTAGRLSFRSAHTGCAGEGSLSPHGDGSRLVFEVTLDVVDCASPYGHLVARYTGLATMSPSGYWDYDSNLRMWLSNSDEAAPVAVTTWGRPG